MWEIHIVDQLVSFLYSVITAVFLSLINDFFIAYRRLKKCSVFSVFFQDLFFWIVAALETFLLLMARCNGEIRGYILLGMLFTAVLWHFTLSRFVCAFFCFLGKKIYALILILRRFNGLICKVTDNVGRFLVKILKNIPKKLRFDKKTLETHR